VRLRKLEAAGADLPGGGTAPRDAAPPNRAAHSDGPKPDVVASFRERMNKRPGFEWDESPPDHRKLL
jgi:hypothetical protein